MRKVEYRAGDLLRNGMDRRTFLRMGFITAATVLIPNGVAAAVGNAPAETAGERSLSFYNLYTKEHLRTVYWKDGSYVPGALDDINFILRDLRTGKVKSIDRKLLDLLSAVQAKLECEEPYHIISGYRTPRSNALLGMRKSGVAKNSLHIYGKAVDVRLPGRSIRDVRSAAMSFHEGGVGYYPRSQFVHIDVGQVRYWRG